MDRRGGRRRHDNYAQARGSQGWMPWTRPGGPPLGGAVLWIGPFPLPHQKEQDKEMLEAVLLPLQCVARIKMHHQFAFVTLTDSSVIPEVRRLVGKHSVRGGPTLRAEHRVFRTEFRTVQKSPLAIRFSQPVISQTFRNEKKLDETLWCVTKSSSSSKICAPFRPIRIARRNGDWVTMDNRRLCVLQAQALECWPSVPLVDMYEFKTIPSEHLAKFDGHFSKFQNDDRRQVLIKDTRMFGNSSRKACERGVVRRWSWEQYIWGMEDYVTYHFHLMTLWAVLFAIYHRVFLWPTVLVFALTSPCPMPSFIRRAVVDYAVGSNVTSYTVSAAAYALLLVLPVLYWRMLHPRMLFLAFGVSVVTTRIAWRNHPPDSGAIFRWRWSHCDFSQRPHIPKFSELPIAKDAVDYESESSGSDD